MEGRLRLLYGRIYAEFRFLARGASFVHEDSTIFSPEDLNTASDELKLRFLAALVNSEPVRLTLHADPDHARLELDGRPVRSGETLELPPGPVTVRATADDHQSMAKELELEAGTAEELYFVLNPFAMETLGVTLPGPGSSVYMGSLYLGGNKDPGTPDKTSEETTEETDEAGIAEEIKPGFFSVYVPVGQYRYIRVDTEDGLTGEAIVRGSLEDEVRIVTLNPRVLPGRDEKPVEEKRRKFYGAYGRFWVALPLAFLISGFYQTYYNSYLVGAYSSGNQTMHDNARRMSYVTIGAWAVTGVFLAETLIRMGIYVNTSSKESIPLWE